MVFSVEFDTALAVRMVNSKISRLTAVFKKMQLEQSERVK